MNADIIFLMEGGEIVFKGKYNELLKINKKFLKNNKF
jgi:ABC-type transport system involved in Fe-S cluster assembly fused permease/ATPase subunit